MSDVFGTFIGIFSWPYALFLSFSALLVFFVGIIFLRNKNKWQAELAKKTDDDYDDFEPGLYRGNAKRAYMSETSAAAYRDSSGSGGDGADGSD